MYMLWIIIPIALFAAVYPSFSIKRSIYLKSLCRKKGDEKAVALTFDDGPDPYYTPRILELLARHNTKATFFLTGEKAELYPELTRRILEEGHTIGNHTYSHRAWFPFYSKGKMKNELDKTASVLKNITGKQVRLFRPPFGVTNPAIAYAVDVLGYTSIGWSIRSLDTVKKSRQSILKRILAKLHNGAVILLHDHYEHSGTLLNELLKELKERGFSMKSIDKLFNIEAYEN